MILFIGGTEVVFIFLAILLLFGSKKIPEIARSMGKGMREFQKATDDIKRELKDVEKENPLKDTPEPTNTKEPDIKSPKSQQ